MQRPSQARKPLAQEWAGLTCERAGRIPAMMKAVLQALARGFGQLGDPAILAVMVRSVLVTLMIFAVFAGALYAGLTWLFAWAGWADGGWASAAAAIVIALLSAWLMFRVIALAVLQFYADRIIAAVEARHFPDAAASARALPLAEEVTNSLRGVGRALALNALALPVAGVLLVTGVGAAAVFLGVNAWLLGRELTDMAWLRYRRSAQEPSPVPRAERLMLGAAVAGIMLVPFINLIAPIVGAAAGTHLAHGAMGLARERDRERGNG